MPIEPVKIPQNVYVEDRIVGPVTLKQLLITGVGAGISYVLFSIVTKAGYSLPVKVIAWIPAFIASMFAFMRINDLSLFNIILLVIESTNKPSQRYWSPSSGLSINLITRESAQTLDAAQAKARETERRLAEMTAELEKRQAELNQITAPIAIEASSARPKQTVPSEGTSLGGPADMRENLSEMAESPVTDTDRIEHGSALPVVRSRIGVTALEPHRSIDTICSDIPTYLGFHS